MSARVNIAAAAAAEEEKAPDLPIPPVIAFTFKLFKRRHFLQVSKCHFFVGGVCLS